VNWDQINEELNKLRGHLFTFLRGQKGMAQAMMAEMILSLLRTINIVAAGSAEEKAALFGALRQMVDGTDFPLAQFEHYATDIPAKLGELGRLLNPPKEEEEKEEEAA
jgi:hypothetical protein